MANISYEQQSQTLSDEVDYFDHLPDPILLLIFNKLFDAKSLCRCLAVSKRFATLVPEVESVCIKMNHPKSKQPIEEYSKTRNGSKSFFKNIMSKLVIKPFIFLQQAILNGKRMSSSSSYYGSGVDIFNWVGTALSNFHDVKSIKLELPCHGGEIGINKSTPLLKWEAGFGKDMERCVILGATSVGPRKGHKVGLSANDEGVNNNDGHNDSIGNNSGNDEHVFTDEELKLRIIWIISCLIASSGRHSLMKKMVGECPKLSNAVISDAGMQGKLHMNAEQIKELRASIESTTHTNTNKEGDSRGSEPEAATPSGVVGSTATQMGYVGNLVMKLWYVKELELPSGQVMKGATLVVIKPESKVEGKESDGMNLWGSFEGEEVFEEAAKELLRRKEKRVYRLEMNSF